MVKNRFRNEYSTFFDDSPVCRRGCDWAGCAKTGEHRAPKSPKKLQDYYWFCLEHVRIYNAEWDFLKGLSEPEIESVIREATVWERPTKKLGASWKAEDLLRARAQSTFRNGEDVPPESKAEPLRAEEVEALSVLGLVPPVSFSHIKARYRVLAKRHHPDANGGKAEAVEKIKCINQAFALLRALYDPHKENEEEG